MQKLRLGSIFGLIVVLVVIMTAFGGFFTVQPGQVAFVKTFGKLGDQEYSEGMHMKAPFISTAIKMNTQIQKLVVENADSASKDLQSVVSDIAVNYSIKPTSARSIYQQVGTQRTMESTLIVPSVEETIKKVTAQFTAEELITKRQEVGSAIVSGLKEKLEPHGLNVVDVNIVNFSFSPEFDAAIEQKVKAEQDALTEENKLKAVEARAKQTVVKAKAEAESIRIQAEAITQQGGENYVQLQWIGKWDGKLPQVQSEGGGILVDFRGNQ